MSAKQRQFTNFSPRRRATGLMFYLSSLAIVRGSPDSKNREIQMIQMVRRSNPSSLVPIDFSKSIKRQLAPPPPFRRARSRAYGQEACS
jgi:hypothetical protein